MCIARGLRCLLLVFFKQKTAYEIGLGIPAEPLFRSNHETNINIIDVLPRTPGNNVYVGFMVWSNFTATKCRGLVSLNQVIKRSEERRVGKECKCWWTPFPYIKEISHQSTPHVIE